MDNFGYSYDRTARRDCNRITEKKEHERNNN